MFRVLLTLALILTACTAIHAEQPAEILDSNAPKPELKPEKKALPFGTVDEPDFKATFRSPNAPSPNFDPDGKGAFKALLPKRNVWAVPQEDGVAPATGDNAESQKNAGGGDAAESAAKYVEEISPALAAVIAREKSGAHLRDLVPQYQAIAVSELQNAAAHYRLGLALYKSGERQKGLVELEAAIAIAPKCGKYLCDYAIVALQSGWIEKAYAAGSAAVKINPNSPRYLSAFADVHMAAGHLPEAIDTYMRAYKNDPQNPNHIYNIGQCYLNGREYKRSIECFSEAIRIKPNYSHFYCSRGLAFENLKNYKMALDDYAAAIKLDPKNPYGHYLLAGVFSDPDDPTLTNRFEAVDHAEKAVKLTNYKNAQYLMGLARALRVARNYEQAVEVAKKAVEIEPGRSDYRTELARYESLKATGIER